jgi:hypothetical protein
MLAFYQKKVQNHGDFNQKLIFKVLIFLPLFLLNPVICLNDCLKIKENTIFNVLSQSRTIF